MDTTLAATLIVALGSILLVATQLYFILAFARLWKLTLIASSSDAARRVQRFEKRSGKRAKRAPVVRTPPVVSPLADVRHVKTRAGDELDLIGELPPGSIFEEGGRR
jgi:hypothetical protein